MTTEITSRDVVAEIEKHITRAKARLAEYKRAANETKVKHYELLLRRQRQAIFDAEDAANAALGAKDASLFKPFAELYPKANKAILTALAI